MDNFDVISFLEIKKEDLGELAYDMEFINYLALDVIFFLVKNLSLICTTKEIEGLCAEIKKAKSESNLEKFLRVLLQLRQKVTDDEYVTLISKYKKQLIISDLIKKYGKG